MRCTRYVLKSTSNLRSDTTTAVNKKHRASGAGNNGRRMYVATSTTPPTTNQPKQVRDPLATTYNDSSVLENFHISEAFKVLYEERTNILDGLGVDEMRHFRQFIIKVWCGMVWY